MSRASASALPIGHGYSPVAPSVFENTWDNNKDGNDDGIPPALFSRYAGATVFTFASAAIWMIWAVALINTVFTDGFPQLGTMPSYGNVAPYGYLTSRYGWDWWCICILSWNVALPMLMCYALANNQVDTWRQLHEFVSKIAMLANIVIFLILTWRWAFYCNVSYSAYDSACNDYRYCCAYFPSPFCPNNAPCTPNYGPGDLVRNNEMFQHWVFSLVFFITSCWSYNQNGFLYAQGVLQ